MPSSKEEFEAVFPSLVQDLTEHTKQYGTPENALKWFQEVCFLQFISPTIEIPYIQLIPPQNLTHNTLGGKLNRGVSVLDTTSILSSAPLTPLQTHSASTLGWLTELLQAFFLVSDDIMDSSHTRRSQPCWFRFPTVGMIAINDAFMLESAIYVLLKKHFRTHPQYLDLIELFHDITFKTEIGQACDLITAPEDKVNLDSFDMGKYTFIVLYKTAYYSFYLPVALALYYLQLATPSNLQQAHDILIPLGEYFQVQDDYLDAFGSPETIGKVGTDIQDNKCSWLINQALLLCSPAQKKVLEENYGRKDKQMEKRVKTVYEELGLDTHYKQFEEKRVQELREMIAGVDETEGLKKDVFEAFLGKIYKRTK